MGKLRRLDIALVQEVTPVLLVPYKVAGLSVCVL